MLFALNREILEELLMKLKEDGTGLSRHESARFMDLAKRADVRAQASSNLLDRVDRLLPLVKAHFEAALPSVG